MDSLFKVGKLMSLFNNLRLNTSPNIFKYSQFNRQFSVTTANNDLMEFFDVKKNWGVEEIRSGRSWRKDDLRLKSNTDLHKLWYVLLKERNMLLTMEQECKDQARLFPSPERLDKVEDSMENLECVVRERNVAYHKLETGETGERPGKMETSAFGLKYYYKMCEYPIPKFMNKKWTEKYKFFKYDKDVEAFLLKYREKIYIERRRKRARDFNHVIGLMNRFPNMDMDALQQQYPDVDIKKAKNSRKYGGHFAPK